MDRRRPDRVVLRFGWKSPAGTYAVSLGNNAGDRSYIALFTVTAGQANTDTTQTLVIPGDTTGTWETGTNGGIWINFVMAGGTTLQGVTGWQAGYKANTATCTNGMATVGNVFELYDVSLHLDPLNTGVAPPWQMPDEAEELRACQRYYAIAPINARFNAAAGGTAISTTIQWPVVMRVTPSTSAAGGISLNLTSGTISSARTIGARADIVAAAAGSTYWLDTDAIANARM